MAEETNPKLTELQQWVRDAWRLLNDSEKAVVNGEVAARFEMLWGLCAQSIRFSAAWEQLTSTPFLREAQVLVRSALEHAVTAQWVHFSNDGAERLTARVQGEYYRYFTDMAAWQNIAEVAAALPAEGPTTAKEEAWPNFTRTLLPQLDEGNFLRASYRALSRATHVNDSTVLSFLFEDAGQVGITTSPSDINIYSTAFTAATSSMLALSVIADHLADDSMVRRLNGVSNALNIPMYLNDARTEAVRQKYDSPPSS